jgi:hypothetical protein
MDTIINIILSSITILIALVAVYYAKRADENFKKPRIDLELSPDHVLFMIRNVGTDIAVNIRETNGLLRDVPDKLWNFSGPIDYIRTKNFGISRPMNFHDDKRPQPLTSTQVHFEYENTDGDKFYSDINIERGNPTQQIYFTASRLIKWGSI